LPGVDSHKGKRMTIALTVFVLNALVQIQNVPGTTMSTPTLIMLPQVINITIL
jgi:hypothetical protein